MLLASSQDTSLHTALAFGHTLSLPASELGFCLSAVRAASYSGVVSFLQKKGVFSLYLALSRSGALAGPLLLGSVLNDSGNKEACGWLP